MEKIFGATGRKDRLMQIGRAKWEIAYGYGTDGENGWEWRQRFTHKPTDEEIRAAVIDQINANVTEAITTGFEWNGRKVWLSVENQLNIASIAQNLGSVTFPLTYKINEDEDGIPVYCTFESAEEFSEFSQAASAYVIATLQAGWQEKEDVDWDAFSG